MTTARDLIQSALEELGVYAPGETMSDADAERGLFTLNDMLDEWASEYLFVTQQSAITATLSNAKASYTIGQTGSPDISAPRPVRIDYGPSRASVVVSAATTAINIVSAIEWNSIYSINPGFGTPTTLYYDPQSPLGVVNLSPTPNATGTLTFNAWTNLQSFINLAATANLTNGVRDALKQNLAVGLKPYFADTPLNPVTITKAAQAKDAIRILNVTSRAMLNRTRVARG